MRISTLLFTYNRPFHTKKVIEALRENTRLPDDLYIFHDGKKKSTDANSWNEVEQIIQAVDWCENQVFTSELNKGLADSIIDGVNMAFKNHDAVIVLEDDCVPDRLFMEYMISALEKYQHSKSVFSIGAFPQSKDVPPNGTDAYFMGRICSWGWATWKDKWQCFRRDYRFPGKIKKDVDLRDWLNIWGQDLEATVIGDVTGKFDTWAAFWALSVINEKGLCLIPYKSFVRNIGFDGTGVHCLGDEPVYDAPEEEKQDIVLPDKIEVIDNYKQIFANYFPWTDPVVREQYYRKTLLKWLDAEQKNVDLVKWFTIKDIKKICVWGLGEVGRKLIDRISSIVTIDAIIETVPQKSEINGFKCISPDEIPKDIDCIIVTPGYDMERINLILDEDNERKTIPIDKVFDPPFPWLEKGVHTEKMGNDYGGFNVVPELLSDGGIVYSFGIDEDLSFSEDLLKNYDVSIFAFDPTPKSIHYVKEHALSSNNNFNFEGIGLSDKDGVMRFHMPVNEKHVSGSGIMHEGVRAEYVEVPVQSFRTILREYGHEKISLLKMDIEGSEFAVIEAFSKEDFVFDQLCVEIHGRFFMDGYDKVYELCKKMIDMGYVLVHVSDSCEEISFARKDLLKKLVL